MPYSSSWVSGAVHVMNCVIDVVVDSSCFLLLEVVRFSGGGAVDGTCCVVLVNMSSQVFVVVCMERDGSCGVGVNLLINVCISASGCWFNICMAPGLLCVSLYFCASHVLLRWYHL